MNNPLIRVDAILRSATIERQTERSRREIVELAAALVLCAAIYGGAMGSWGLFAPSALHGDGWLSSLYSALKVPLLLVVTFLLSLPVLFISYTLAGLRSDFERMLHALVEIQAGLAIILGGLAPLTLVWYASSDGYQEGVLFNALMFAIATLAAQSIVRRRFHSLVRREKRHRSLLRLWIVVYIFIGIQMGWSLRPFIGTPSSAVTFFRTEELDNAYEAVAGMIWKMMGG
jgi:hypothetical protein